MKYSRESIKKLLLENDRAVERGIVAIFNRQTSDEKYESATKYRNKIGFNAADSRLGTYYATWIKKGNRLDTIHLSKARKLITKYSNQLTDIANEQK